MGWKDLGSVMLMMTFFGGQSEGAALRRPQGHVPPGFAGLQNLTRQNAKITTFSHRLIRNVVLQYGYVGNDPNMPCLIPERRQWGRRLEK